MARGKSKDSSKNSANIGFEQNLWLAADKLRSNMDAAEYNDYARPALDKNRLGELIDLIGTIELIPREAQSQGSAGASPAQLGALADQPPAAETLSAPYRPKMSYNRSKDILGRVSEYVCSTKRISSLQSQ